MSLDLKLLDRRVGQVLGERPRHPGADLLSTRVDTITADASNGAAIAILRTRHYLCARLKAHIGQVLLAVLTERLPLLGSAYLGEPDDRLRLIVATDLDRIAVSEADDET